MRIKSDYSISIIRMISTYSIVAYVLNWISVPIKNRLLNWRI